MHSICLPSRSKKAINWGIHYDHHYEEEFNPQIIYSPIYQELYSKYLALKEHHTQEKNAIKQVNDMVKQEIGTVESTIGLEEEKEERLQGMRQGLYG